ncbi:MAG: hypothetical protein WB239_05870 [Acidimicrobiia bacterium]
MNEAEIRTALDDAEAAVERGESLSDTDFWKAVGAVKRSPDLAGELGPRIAAIDQQAFRPFPMITVAIGLGTVLAVLATLVGLGCVAASYYLDQPWNWLIFGLGVVALFASTHGLAHLITGAAMGMRFTCWFVAGPLRPQPGVKIDYATYLLVPARRRAWMHASGALFGKILPFALIPAALAADLPGWVSWVLLAFGLVQIVTDVLWSTRSSDWKRFRREMRYAGS